MPQKYFVKSTATGNVYECTASERTNLVARGYRDVTNEQGEQPRSAAQPQRRPVAPGPASQNPADAAQS